MKLQVIQNMIDIKEDERRWFTILLTKNLLEVVLKAKLNKINNSQMNFMNQSLENFKKERFIHHLKTIFEVQIQLVCN